MKFGKLCQLSSMLVLMVSLPLTVAAERKGLGSDEIKNIRFLSRALIKSRANEKKRIEQELVSQRQQLEDMKKLLDNIDVEMVKSMSSSKVMPVNMSSVGNMVIDGKIVFAGENTNSQAVMVPQATWQSKKMIKVAINELDTSRVAISNTVPKKWEFWKSKTTKDHRAEKIISTSDEVGQALSEMVVSNKAELAKLRSLKEKLTLKKKDMPLDDIYPTLETRTKHRQ